MAVRITCVDKDNGNHYNPHEAIESLGWIDESTRDKGIATLSAMVDFLEKGGNAYVSDVLGNKAYLKVMSRNGSKYVQTYSDGKLSDNLLELDECTA
ncbi:MAG: DUF3892 domain-containing protein [bacterium]